MNENFSSYNKRAEYFAAERHGGVFFVAAKLIVPKLFQRRIADTFNVLQRIISVFDNVTSED